MLSSSTRREVLQWMASSSAAVALFPLSQGDLSAEEPKSGERSRIRVGQIGTMHPHATKLSVYRQSADYEVVGVVEEDAQQRAQAEKHPAFAGVRWMSQEQLLAEPGLQVVLVETEISQLLDVAESCLAAGKHIHLDKPAGASLPHFRKVLQRAEQQQLLVQMGYMYRYNPGVVLMHEFLQQGWLGEIFEVHAVMSKVVPPADRVKEARFPGGVFFEVGGHLMDLVVHLLGKPESVTSILQHIAPIDDHLKDSGLAVLTYPRATATIRATGVEIAGGERRHLTVCGTRGTCTIQPLDQPSLRVAFDQPRGPYRQGYQDIVLSKYTRYVEDAADMARILRGEARNRFSYAHDLTVQECLLKACQMPGN